MHHGTRDAAGGKVSIVMPLYNCERYVSDSIESVLSQTYEEWELLIVDDCSSDGSYEIAKQYAVGDSRIVVEKLSENSGAAVARNVAIEKARGRYIAFLDSDDLWTPEKLERQINFMKETGAALSFSDYCWIDEDGKSLQKIEYPFTAVDYSELLKQNVIGCLTAVYDTGQVAKCYFDESLQKHEDYLYWLRILKKTERAHRVPEPLAYYRIRQGSVSSNKIRVAGYVWKIYREYERLPLLRSLRCFGWYTFKSVVKYGMKRGKCEKNRTE